ncbi:MAG: hypothetical protein WC072_05215, partial [Methanoregulaceae archaeon]
YLFMNLLVFEKRTISFSYRQGAAAPRLSQTISDEQGGSRYCRVDHLCPITVPIAFLGYATERTQSDHPKGGRGKRSAAPWSVIIVI